MGVCRRVFNPASGNQGRFFRRDVGVSHDGKLGRGLGWEFEATGRACAREKGEE